jgi:S-adenosylmethionine synthetase
MKAVVIPLLRTWISNPPKRFQQIPRYFVVAVDLRTQGLTGRKIVIDTYTADILVMAAVRFSGKRITKGRSECGVCGGAWLKHRGGWLS